MGFESFDWSHLAGTSPVVAALIYIAFKVLKPLLENFFTNLTEAIRENTSVVKALGEAIRALGEKQEDANTLNATEHAEQNAKLNIIVDKTLQLNGEMEPEDKRELREHFRANEAEQRKNRMKRYLHYTEETETEDKDEHITR